MSGRAVASLFAGALAALAAGGAAQEPDGPAVNWARARDLDARYRTVVDTSGLVEVARFSERVDPNDLGSLCRARLQVATSARERLEGELQALGDWHDPISDEQRAGVLRLLGTVASFEGDMDAAARWFAAGRDALAPHVDEYPDLLESFLELQEVVGIAQMRRGEVANCLVNPSADRCLFPLLPGGHHHDVAGAEAAVAAFRAYLERAPGDLEVRWLLNLAFMVLGRYPAAVPGPLRFDPARFASEVRMPRFVDAARRAGIGRRGIAGGTVADDMDGDGLADVVFSSVDRCEPLRLYRSRGDGTFEDVSEAAGLLDQLGGINLVQADYDNDGRLDLFVMRGGWEVPMRNSLLRNEGGRFRDVTAEAGLLGTPAATHSAAWADVDGDGWLDLFVAEELAPSRLYRNRGDGRFEDVTAAAGVGRTAFSKGAVFGDYDDDGDPDLYVSNMFGENFLYRNDGGLRFTEVAAAAGVQRPLVSFPCWFFDYDQDGRLDLFVASYPPSLEEFAKHYLGERPVAETLTLYRNRGDGTFEDVTGRVGLDRVVPAMGANFGDLDGDGYPDLYLGTGTPSLGALMPNIMLHNDAGRRFSDVTEATGTGHLQKGHGVAFTDLDNDGDEDVILNVGGAVPGDSYDEAVFENPGSAATWLGVRLVGARSNRAAIGARLTLQLAGAAGERRYREVTSGGSFGASSLAPVMGLGGATGVAWLEVRWPGSGTRQRIEAPPVNAFIEIREGESGFARRDLPRLRLGGGPPP